MRLRSLNEAECYARCHGEGDGDNVRVVNNFVFPNEARFELGLGAGITVENTFVGDPSLISTDDTEILGTVVGDPRLVGGLEFEAKSYRIQKSSPARDAGVAVREVKTDYLGSRRPQGATYDIGAFESR